MNKYQDANEKDIVEIITKAFPTLEFKKSGDRLVANCPFWDHQDDTPSFTIYIKTNSFYCFGCGRGGGPIEFIKHIEHCDASQAADIINGNTIQKRKITKNTNQNSIADIETRDRVYREFLEKLILSKKHGEDLLRRGLSREEIKKLGYKTIPQRPQRRWEIVQELAQKYDLSQIPGFFDKQGKHGKYWDCLSPSGYLIPVKDLHGRIQALIIRTDNLKAKYIWFSSSFAGGASTGSPVHYTKNVASNNFAVLTEGILKADVAHHLSDGIPMIGISGVNATKNIYIPPNIKKIYIAFDADYKTNQNVNKALNKIKEELKHLIRVDILDWDIEYGKGIDDLLLNYPEVLEEIKQVG